MLKSKDTLQEKEVVGFKIVTGEEVIGRVEQIDGNKIRLFSPLSLIGHQDGPALTGSSYLMEDKTTVDLNLDQVVFTFSVKKEFVKQYDQITSPIVKSNTGETAKI